jgi:Mn-containing catalase
MKLMGGTGAKESVIHEAMVNPHFLVESAGGPILTDSRGVPWNGTYVNANGDLTVDLRSNMGAESRAKIVYEYLMKFTDDPYVKETLTFLMTREVAHFQMFQAALETIQPNFPPGVLQADPRHSNTYFNMSNGSAVRGPWNEGTSSELGETWQYIEDPIAHVEATNGLVDQEIAGTDRTDEIVSKMNKTLSKERSEEVLSATPDPDQQWSSYVLNGAYEDKSTNEKTRRTSRRPKSSK